MIDKVEAVDNPETAPYFLTLDIPVSDEEPFGPAPYLECDGQCNWVLPGGPSDFTEAAVIRQNYLMTALAALDAYAIVMKILRFFTISWIRRKMR